MKLTLRTFCPICFSREIEDLVSIPYLEPALRAYLSNYYQLDARGLLEEFDSIFARETYVLCRCKACRLVFQRFVPDEQIQNLVYGRWIDGATKETESTSGFSFDAAKHYMTEAMRISHLMIKKAPNNASRKKSSLDFGFGKGGFAMALKACGHDVFGFDFSRSRQNSAIANGIAPISIQEIPDHEFDFINTEQVFEHLPNLFEVAEKLASSLRKGGILKISVPYSRSVERGDYRIDWRASRYGKNSPMPNAPLEHLQYFRHPSLEILADRLGLKPIKVPASTYLNFSVEWLKPKQVLRNVGRALLHDRMRNYRLFEKIN